MSLIQLIKRLSNSGLIPKLVYTQSLPSIKPGKISSISEIGKASSQPRVSMAASGPTRRPVQISCSLIFSWQKSTYSPCSRPEIKRLQRILQQSLTNNKSQSLDEMDVQHRGCERW